MRWPDVSRGAAPRLVAAALAVAAVSLVLLPPALAFDPWAWLVWGHEVSRGALDTAGGPSWKPLPVLVTTPLALTGAAAPLLWLLVARAGGVLALAGAHRLAGQLAGRAAAWIAVAAMAFSEWWLFNTALGNSEGLLAAAVLWAIAAHLAGHHLAALALAVVAGLLRPKAWPFLGLYALWLWRRRAAPPAALAAGLVVPLLWLGPDLAGTGGAVGAATAARGTASPDSAVHADVPALQVLADFADLMTLPVAAAAVAGAALGGRTERYLAAGSVAWVAIVAAMAQAGFAGNPRYNVAPAAVACVLAGVGATNVAPALAAALRPAAAIAGCVLAAAVLAITAGALVDQVGEVGKRARRGKDLDVLVARAGGALAVRACAPPRTVQPMRALLAWRLDVPLAHLTERPRPPVTVFRAPAGYAAEPVGPRAPPGAATVAVAGDWTLLATCAGGRRGLRRAGGGTGS